jgi:hypothetical protein
MTACFFNHKTRRLKMTPRSTVMEDVYQEMKYAADKWGEEFDDKNDLNDWITYMIIYAGRAAAMGVQPESQYLNLIKVIGLAINAAQRVGSMPKRHYDK